MKIVEDPEDRNRLFERITTDRFIVRPKQYGAPVQAGWPRKHMLWPCVRLGAGTVFLEGITTAKARQKRGAKAPDPKPSTRGSALNFLRGHSHEALMADGQSMTFVYKGVANEVDEWTGEEEAPFTEIKSTMLSSAHMLPIVRDGSVDLLFPHADLKFLSYFQQCCQNCVALGIDHCRLRIFFMNGEYGLRRKKCPDCEGELGPQQDVFKQCRKCGYKSYSVDLRSYILTYTQRELSHFRQEVFAKRRDQYNLAIEATSPSELLMRAEGTKCFLCVRCDVGKELGCEHAGAK